MKNLDLVGIARPFCSTPDMMKPFLTGEINHLQDHFTPDKSSFLKFFSAGGYYAKQIIDLAHNIQPNLGASADAGGLFLMKHEAKKAFKKRFLSYRK